jgi:hypothetical protein
MRTVERAKKKTIVMYPAFKDAGELADQYHRLRWYLPESGAYDVHMLVDPALKVTQQQLDADIPPHIQPSAGQGNNIKVAAWSPARFASLAARSAAVGVWKTSSARRLDKLSMLLGRRFVVIDPTAISTWEFARYATFPFDHMSGAEKSALRARSKERLVRASIDLQELRKAYVFGTGPSLEKATEFDFSDGVRIVCNSIVRNPELLAHIKPHFITASDFVFHFGPSRYAAEFRRDLMSALDSTGAYFLVPDQCAPLMFQHFPELEERTIAVPLTNRYDLREKRRGVNVQLLDRFQVRTLDSVLNLLMLPLASTLAEEIFILGCDGRKPSDQAFWSHHGASQYAGLMRTVNDTHPGFFDVDYVDYYDRYCSHVASVIAAGEAVGKRYASLVPSYVPALQERPARPAHALETVPVT